MVAGVAGEGAPGSCGDILGRHIPSEDRGRAVHHRLAQDRSQIEDITERPVEPGHYIFWRIPVSYRFVP